jgi:hypothetical protein
MARNKITGHINMKVTATPSALKLIEELKKITEKTYYFINLEVVAMEVHQCVIQ